MTADAQARADRAEARREEKRAAGGRNRYGHKPTSDAPGEDPSQPGCPPLSLLHNLESARCHYAFGVLTPGCSSYFDDFFKKAHSQRPGSGGRGSAAAGSTRRPSQTSRGGKGGGKAGREAELREHETLWAAFEAADHEKIQMRMVPFPSSVTIQMSTVLAEDKAQFKKLALRWCAPRPPA